MCVCVCVCRHVVKNITEGRPPPPSKLGKWPDELYSGMPAVRICVSAGRSVITNRPLADNRQATLKAKCEEPRKLTHPCSLIY